LKTDSISKAVVYYTEILDLKVFPLHNISDGACTCSLGKDCDPSRAGKHPRIRNWQKEASSHKQKVKNWWEQWPEENICIPTGKINGFFVIDIDPQNGGWLSYQDHLSGELPSTYSPTTGSGGQHIWFKYPDSEALGFELTNHNKFPRGIDVRANGGYVVGAPSVSLKGRYIWPDNMLTEIGELADCPITIIEQYLEPESNEFELVDSDSCKAFSKLSAKEKSRIDRYVTTALKKELDHLRGMDFRHEWDNETFKTACRILELAKAPWSPLTYEKAVRAIWHAVPKPDGAGWTEQRVQQKIKSAWNRITSHELVRPFPMPSTGKEETEDEPLRSRLLLRPFSDRVAKPYEWHDIGWIPKKGVVVLAGEPGAGKSTLLCHWISKFTTGEWGGNEGSRCIYMAGTEDSLDDVVKPRLVAAGANIDKVFTLEVEERDENEDVFVRRTSFNEDLNILKNTIKDNHINVILMDPANTFLGIDEEKNSYSEIRIILEKVIRFAEEHDVLVILIKHFKKAQQGNGTLSAINRLYGSAAWSEVPRHCLVLRKVDDEMREKKGLESDDMVSAVLSVEKNSYGKTAATGLAPIGYMHEDVKVTVDGLKNQIVSKFINLGIRKDLNDLDSVATLSEEQVDRKIKEEDTAKQWIIETLQGYQGRMEMQAIKLIHERDEKMKVSWRTLLRKADQLGIKKEAIPGAKDNRKEWVLPDEYMPKPGELQM